MAPRRRPWLVAALLLLLGTVTAAGAVQQHWLPCRGSMLNGSALRGYAYGSDFTDGCLRAMDDGFALVWPDGAQRWGAESVLGVTTTLLLTLAWTVVVVSSAWSNRTKVLLALPAVAAAAAGGVSLLRGVDGLDGVYTLLLIGVDALALGALVVLDVREKPTRRQLLQCGLVLAALGAVGWFPALADFVLMASFSDANWDSPPGSGYPTVAWIAVLTVALLVATLARRPRPAQAASSKARAAVSALP